MYDTGDKLRALGSLFTSIGRELESIGANLDSDLKCLQGQADEMRTQIEKDKQFKKDLMSLLDHHLSDD